MSKQMTRREFVRNVALTAGAVGLYSMAGPGVLASTVSRQNMCGFAAKPLDRVRVGVVGLGMRGPQAVERLSKMKDVDITALCDIRPGRVSVAQLILEDHGRPAAREFTDGPEDWKNLCQMDLDLVYIATPWNWHVPMALGAMKNGKHAAVEVPAALDIDGCWELVETSETTKQHCMMLENCCYDFFELQTLNMVRRGVFGELTHAEGAYIHSLVNYMQPVGDEEIYQGNWRIKHNLEKNGNLYPTHGLGPIATCLDINRGDRMEYLVSMESNDFNYGRRALKEAERDPFYEEFVGLPYRGNMNAVSYTHLRAHETT